MFPLPRRFVKEKATPLHRPSPDTARGHGNSARRRRSFDQAGHPPCERRTPVSVRVSPHQRQSEPTPDSPSGSSRAATSPADTAMLPAARRGLWHWAALASLPPLVARRLRGCRGRGGAQSSPSSRNPAFFPTDDQILHSFPRSETRPLCRGLADRWTRRCASATLHFC